MKRTYHSYLTAIVLVAAMLCCSLRAYAAVNWLFIQGSMSAENGLLLPFSDPTNGAEMPAAEQFQIRFNGETVPVTDVRVASEEPVTYYCVADISGLSKYPRQLQMEKDVLYALCDLLRDGDRAVFATLGENLNATDYLSDPETFRAAIDGLGPTDQETNLYRGLVDAISDLSSTDKATPRKCLIILSDGQDFYTQGEQLSATKNRADELITSSRIPVYTVPIMNEALKNDTWYMTTIRPVLINLSEESAGGKTFNPLLDSDIPNAAAASAAIVDSMHSDCLLEVDLSAYQEPAAYSALPNLITLTVQFTGSDGRTYTDTLTLDKAELSLDLNPLPEPGWWERYRIYVFAGAAALAVIAVVVIVLAVGSGKKKAEAERQRQAEAERQRQAEEERQRQAEEERQRQAEEERQRQAEAERQRQAEEERQRQAEEERKRLEEEKRKRQKDDWKSLPHQVLTFHSIGPEALHFRLSIPENVTVTVGKDSRSDYILNPDDKKLSGIHMRLLYRDGALRIWDGSAERPSTNGVYVDGTKVTGPQGVTVKADGMQDHKIRAGGFEYRLRFEGRA